ncbi:YSIRK-type signal peptide-containing protein [Streptococcus anginosus]|uniref:mucin-binding protein n=1 Tax=Streptococcus anginosus TaxID=1328 RepID=UPI001C8C28F0|nr:MucBP domain-containing protein [Streptococcus anginosus]MBX9075174.1 YSIRK-type signal peptide-containing protein [Streptococcus anginosus]
MKSFKLYNGKRDKFSLRKKNVGLVSIAIASLAIYGLAIGAPTVQADENSSVSAVSTENVTAPASTDTTAAAGLASEVSTPSTSVSTTEVPVSEGTSAGAENNSSPAPATVSENAASASGATAVEKVETPAQTTGQPDEKVSVPTTSSVAESTNKVSADTSTSAAVAKENSASAEPKPIEQSTNAQSYSAFRSAGAVRTRRSVKEASSHISNFSVTVTTKDGTVMNAGNEKVLSNQEIAFDQIHMKFTLTQDGTLKAGSKIRIPVKLTNNAYGAYYSNLGSGTEEPINGVGTVKFDYSDPKNLAYVITLNTNFSGQKVVEITQKAATIGKFTAKSSYENIVLDINDSKFIFKPKPRTFEKAQAPFAVYNSASSDRANSIKLGTSTGDANYYNNLLSSDGTNSGQTGIPNGDIISIYRIKPGNGSKIVSIKPDLKRYTSTLAISEDGKYLVKGDTSTSISINSDPDNKLVKLPANSTDEEIVKALKQAGKNSSVVIDNGDGTYTVAINLGKMTGNGATTYHDIWPTDDYAQMGDKYQEINRTEEVNRKVSSILKNANVIQGTGHSTRITFADSSIVNTLSEESKSFSYSVDDNGTIKKIKEEKLSAKTTPSNARAEGQKKITVHYVDTRGKEIETQDYKFGFPAGGSATQSPDYTASPKTITGYTLVTADTAIASYGTQLKTTKQIPFTSNDQEFYYVYSAKKSSAKVTYIDDDTNGGKVLETKDLNGFYGQTDPYRTAETIKTYTDRNYELVSDNYPATGVTYNENLQTFEVHLKHKKTSVAEEKTVKETIHYTYEGGAPAAPDHTSSLKFTRTATTDLVTNVTTGDWTAENGTSFAAVTSPAIKGYTPDLAEVPAVDNITSDSPNIEKTVVYKANPASAKVTYIDDTTGETLETKDLNGFYGQTDPYRTAETIKTYTDRNYGLVSDGYPATGVTYNETLQTFEVHLRHKGAAVQETKTVTETIKYVYEDNTEAADTKVQTLKFYRINNKDLVTNKIVYKGPWFPSTGTFPEVVSPKIDGYTPDKATVAVVEQITGDSADIEETVTYKADKQKVTYTIIDDTAQKTLKDKEVLTSGGSDTPLPDSAREKYDLMVNAYLAQGYELVSKDQLPAKFDLDSSHDQNVVVHLKHGTTDIQESKDVNLTVRYHGAGGQTPADKVQTATWTRTVTKDKITGTEVSATPWKADKANYDAVPSPVILGYSVDIETVPSEAVTQENIVKDVYYTIQTQKVTYTVVDETTGQTLENQVELTTGESGAALPAAAQTKYDTVVASYLAQGYEVASQDALPSQFDTDSSVDQNVVIRLKHKVSTSTETKTVTQTINYVYEEDNTPAAPEKKTTLTFSREMKTDEVTKTTTQGAWTPSVGTFPEVVSPVVDGYTPDKEKVTTVNVTATDADINVTVKYKADKQKVTYTIIDDTTNTTLEDKKELTSGNSDTPLPNGTEAKYDSIVDAYLAKGYELVSKDQLPAKFDLDSSYDQNVVVHVKHKVSTSTETKTVTQTINYLYEDDNTPAAPEKKTTLTFSREMKTDEVTKVTTPGAWTPSVGTFPEVISPTVDGYTPDKAKVDAENVTADQADIKVTVKYKADKQKVTYTVIDDTTNTTLKDKELLTSGASDTPLPNGTEAKYDSIVDAYLAQGYELVSKDHLPAKFDLDSSYDQNVVIRLKHKTVSVEETKQVSMTVRYHGAGGQTPADKVQTATWTRTVTTDKVTGSVVNTTDWTSDKANYDAVPSPVIPGYTVDIATVPSEVVTQENIVKDVHYTIQTQKVTYTVVDETTGQTLENQVELTTGDSGAALPAAAQTKYDRIVKGYTDKGYELVSKDDLPAQFDKDSSVDQNVVVHLKHKVTTSSEIKTVKETIHYVYQNGSEARSSYGTSLSFTREVKTDEVTKLSTKGSWSPVTGTFAAVTSPMITGYTADKPIVAAVDGITGDSEDIVETVVYKANQERAQVRYIDDTTGATLEMKELTGDYNTTDSYRTADTISHYTSQGYELVSDNYPSTGVIYNETYQKFEVHLKHGTAESQESKKVSLTVRYHGAGSQTPADNVQTATWTRTVTKDKVTGDVVKATDWTADKANYNAIPSPVIPGYTVDVATVPQEKVTQEDIVKDVHYGIQTQKVTYTVIDDTTGTTLENQVELTTGHSGTNLPTDAQTKYDQMVAAYQAKGYELVSKDELPAKFDLDSSHDQNVTVHLKHGTAESQESKKVSLTVRYHGAGSQTPADNVQTATWTRTVTKDKVTGDVVKTTDWVADKATYDAVPSPVIPGYIVDVATVSAETVTQEDMVKDVYYTAIPVTPDKPTPPVVPSTPDKPTTPTVVPTTPTKATPTKTEILPSTGDSQVGPTLTTLTGVSLLLSAFGYIGRRKKED